MKLLLRNIIVTCALFLSFARILPAQELYPHNLDYALTLKKTYYLINDTSGKALKINLQTSDKRWQVNNELVSFPLANDYDDRLYLAGHYGKSSTWLLRKLTKENLFIVSVKDFKLAVDPLFDLNYKRSFGKGRKNHFQNTRGLLLRGSITDKLYFETSFYENQTNFVNYVNDYIQTYAVVPGLITVKNFKSSSYDYGIAYGLLSYTPLSKAWTSLNIQIGNDKNFFGDGYRSLLLSDCSAPYPFLKINWKYKKLSYTCLFSSFQNISDGNVIHYDTIVWNAGYQKKTGTFHYLSYFVNNRLDLSLFESTIWQVADSGGKHFNPDFFNPIIGFNSAEFGLNGKNNCLLGLNLLFKASNNIHFYGQLAIDDLRLNKISEKGYFHNREGIQVGIEAFDMFGFKNLSVQTEYNQAQPYMYSDKSPSESFTHYNQPLADPLGANFKEGIGIIRYRIRKYFVRAQFNVATYGADSLNSNWGKNLFLTDLSASQTGANKIGQGVMTKMKYVDVCFSWLLNPATNMNIFIGATYRNEKNSFENTHDRFVYFGFRTSLRNEYFDF